VDADGAAVRITRKMLWQPRLLFLMVYEGRLPAFCRSVAIWLCGVPGTPGGPTSGWTEE
jgi:hypothetical protein